MKAENRVKLMCSKHIKDGIYDRFTVTVSASKADEAKKEFERQGYKVI